MADVEDLLDETTRTAADVGGGGTRTGEPAPDPSPGDRGGSGRAGCGAGRAAGGQDAGGPPAEHAYGVSDAERAYDFLYDNPYNKNGKIRLWGLNRFATPAEAGWQTDRKPMDAPLPSPTFDLPCTYARADGRFQKRWTASFHADNGAVVRHRYMEYDTKAHAGRQLVSFRTQLALCDVRNGISAPRQGRIPGCRHKGGSTSTSPSNTASAGSR
ncbi:hypothetical protein ACRJ4B_26810 [Streptomyces sp. GTA36]